MFCLFVVLRESCALLYGEGWAAHELHDGGKHDEVKAQQQVHVKLTRVVSEKAHKNVQAVGANRVGKVGRNVHEMKHVLEDRKSVV